MEHTSFPAQAGSERPTCLWREHRPASTLILDFRHPEPWVLSYLEGNKYSNNLRKPTTHTSIPLPVHHVLWTHLAEHKHELVIYSIPALIGCLLCRMSPPPGGLSTTTPKKTTLTQAPHCPLLPLYPAFFFLHSLSSLKLYIYLCPWIFTLPPI